MHPSPLASGRAERSAPAPGRACLQSPPRFRQGCAAQTPPALPRPPSAHKAPPSPPAPGTARASAAPGSAPAFQEWHRPPSDRPCPSPRHAPVPPSRPHAAPAASSSRQTMGPGKDAHRAAR
ncbi:hypothetical protein HNE_0556 [Hyphomonas neptunium ATCC 15444]|uniref:Uncharacterized protein n=1 Tax=Hyphomonas neptunium (strain ATCC 15444) TaxID=228405 RepID=Q0C4Q8_HYPNA|nr:hypothetical protein HNE_0556 [Hyphomonas neptunium ATCC 15444]